MVFGTGDFTVEFSLFVVSAPAVSAILADGRAALTQGAYPTLYLSPSMTLGYYVSSADRITSGSALSLSTWYHVAIVRSAGVTKLYVNGTQYGSSWTDSTNYIADGLVFGASSYHTSPNTQYGLYGYMDEVRVTVGIARYTAAFTPPTEAFAATQCAYDPFWGGVVSLIHADGTDGSTAITDSTGRVVNVYGGPQIDTAQSKFGGSSILFNGSGYVAAVNTADMNPGTGDFTVEMWVRWNTSTNAGIFHLLPYTPSATLAGIAVGHDGTTWQIYANDTNHARGSTINTGQWYHVALVRFAGTLTLYVDGAALGASVACTVNVWGNHLFLGNYSGAPYTLTGWIDEVRMTKSARYQSNFTPPTEAFYDVGA